MNNIEHVWYELYAANMELAVLRHDVRQISLALEKLLGEPVKRLEANEEGTYSFDDEDCPIRPPVTLGGERDV